MRIAPLLLGISVLGLMACESTTQPSGELNGSWVEVVQPNPGGGGMTLWLTAVGGRVSGTGQVCYVGGICYPGAVTVSGTSDGSFRLALSDGRGWTAAYAGSVVAHDTLQGTWTDALGSASIAFSRAR